MAFVLVAALLWRRTLQLRWSVWRLWCLAGGYSLGLSTIGTSDLFNSGQEFGGL